MRSTWILGLLLAVPAGAQDGGEDEGDRMSLARLAMQAQLRIGDLLHEKGDYRGAMEAYQKALRIYEGAIARAPAAPPEKPKIATDKPFTADEVIEEPEIPVQEVEEAAGEGPRPTGAQAVDDALAWLARHQDEDGRWDADDFMKHDPAGDKCDGAGGGLHDVGLTGLATLAFLGAGYTDRGSAKENKYAKNVGAGLRYLMQSQADDGVFGTRATHSFMYNHAIATLAMCEAFWMTRNPRYKKPAQDGLNFIAMARNPYLAWRYDPRGGENDTSVTGWCVMALKSGKCAGLKVDPNAFEGARLWIDKMTEPNFGQVGYSYPGGQPARPEGKQDKFPAEKTASMTAVGILCRIFLGEDPHASEMIRKGADLCAELPPKWDPDDGSIDMYYWYWGTLSMFRVGGRHWHGWSEAMEAAILKHQHGGDGGARSGSWDPIDAWGEDGGRIYSTAMMALCLEVYYRYDRVFGVR